MRGRSVWSHLRLFLLSQCCLRITLGLLFFLSLLLPICFDVLGVVVAIMIVAETMVIVMLMVMVVVMIVMVMVIV